MPRDYINRVGRFIYWSMNYHIEHHMFPLVPYHRLPELHEARRHDVQAPSRSILSAYAELNPVLLRRRTDPDHFLRRPLPETAHRYREGPDIRAV